ncbi:MAG: flagellar basal body rod protein FlgB [Chloroflexota bacterium]
MLDLSKLDPTARCLKMALDGLSLRQQVTSNNIANVDTPGFKGGEVNFEAQLRRALRRDGAGALKVTHPAHFAFAGESQSAIDKPLVTQSNNLTLRNDGNNVDIEREMAKLAETTITYSAVSQQMAAKLSLLKSIISEGRR